MTDLSKLICKTSLWPQGVDVWTRAEASPPKTDGRYVVIRYEYVSGYDIDWGHFHNGAWKGDVSEGEDLVQVLYYISIPNLLCDCSSERE